MIAMKEITLEDKSLLTKVFSNLHTVSSEFTFAYLFMWRRDYNLKYAVVDGYLCLVSNSRVSIPFAFCPVPVNGIYETNGFQSAMEFLETYFKSQGQELVFGRIEEDKVTLLRHYYQDKIEVEFLPEASDYVYECNDLRLLVGRKYSSKRNHISQFKRHYPDYEYVPVTKENTQDCKVILDDWCNKNETECVHPDNCERLACYEILDNWDAFNMKGALIRVNGRFEAFTLGEQLNDDTAVIRVEKGNSDIHGIYTIINQEFCQREWQHFRWINREEDLGKEGLRRAKESYYPSFMVNKYMIRIKA